MHEVGVAHGAFDDDLTALKATRTLLGYLPQSYDGENPDVLPYDDPERRDFALNTIIPDDPNQSYDMRETSPNGWWTVTRCYC